MVAWCCRAAASRWPTATPSWRAPSRSPVLSGSGRGVRRSSRKPMKILVANPNTSTGVTDRLVAAGKLVASGGTELMPMTAAYGVPYIATRAEAAVGAVAALEMLAERRSGIDAAIVAAFGEPGLGGARELGRASCREG